MPDSLDDKIPSIKTELAIARQAQQLCNVLLQKREELEERIASLIREIENDTATHSKHGDPDSIKNKALEEKKKILATIKSNKQVIDERLDEYEDYSADIVTILEEELIVSLLQKYPDQEVAYNDLNTKSRRQSELLNASQTLLNSSLDLEKLLEHIIEERQKAKPTRILLYFFGRNPNIAIAKMIQASKLLCEGMLGIIKDIHDPLPIFNKLAELLARLLVFTKEHLSYRKIDHTLIPLHRELNEIILELKKLKEETLVSLKTAEEERNGWIEKHSG
jgi:hypothetical protein